MPSLQATVFGTLVVDVALLLGFIYVLFTPRDMPFTFRTQLLRRILLATALAVPFVVHFIPFGVLWPLMLGLNGVTVLIALVHFCRKPSPESKRRDPLWAQGYSHKLEAELADRLTVEKELAFIAAMAERDPNCVIELDAQGRPGYRNPAANTIFPDLDDKGPSHPVLSGMEDVIRLLQRDQKPFYRRPLKYGERVFEQQITSLPESRKISLYMTDVTEWKRLDQMKTELLNTVSHEFRSPLSSFVAAAKMLLTGYAGEINAEQRKMITMMGNSADRLNRLITDLLDLSKMEAGKLNLKRREIDLVTLVDNVAAAFKPLGHEQGIDVVTDVPSKPVVCLADSDKLIQVVTNLTSNAMKFTRAGKITLKVVDTAADVSVSVQDTGIGIAGDQLHRVFGKFQQFGASVRGEKGTGLGLSLCKSLVELHRGGILVDSELGRGTTFTLTLPRLSARSVFDEALSAYYEQTSAEGGRLSAFVLSVEEAPGFEASEKKLALAKALERMVQKHVHGDQDFLLREGATVYFILDALGKADAKEVVDQLAAALIEVAAEAQAEQSVLLRAQFTSLPDDASVLEGLQARLG